MGEKKEGKEEEEKREGRKRRGGEKRKRKRKREGKSGGGVKRLSRECLRNFGDWGVEGFVCLKKREVEK